MTDTILRTEYDFDENVDFFWEKIRFWCVKIQKLLRTVKKFE